MIGCGRVHAPPGVRSLAIMTCTLSGRVTRRQTARRRPSGRRTSCGSRGQLVLLAAAPLRGQAQGGQFALGLLDPAPRSEPSERGTRGTELCARLVAEPRATQTHPVQQLRPPELKRRAGALVECEGEPEVRWEVVGQHAPASRQKSEADDVAAHVDTRGERCQHGPRLVSVADPNEGLDVVGERQPPDRSGQRVLQQSGVRELRRGALRVTEGERAVTGRDPKRRRSQGREQRGLSRVEGSHGADTSRGRVRPEEPPRNPSHLVDSPGLSREVHHLLAGRRRRFEFPPQVRDLACPREQR